MQLNSRQNYPNLPVIINRTLIANLSLSLLLFLVALLYLPKAQPELPLFYTLDNATGPITHKWLLLIIPSLTLVLSLINFAVVIKLQVLLSELILKLYVFANLVVTLILALAMLRIIYVTW